jgi:hypothetical protein
VRVRFIDEAAEYQTGGAAARVDAPKGGGAEDVDLALVTDAGAARRVAARRLRAVQAERDSLRLPLGPLEALRREAGDRVTVEGFEGLWRVTRVDADEHPSVTLARCETGDSPAVPERWAEPARGVPGAATFGPPLVHVLDLGPLPGAEMDTRPLIAASADPWRPLEVWAGPSAEAMSLRARIDRPAAVGVTLEPLGSSTGRRLDRSSLTIQIEGGRPEARAWAALASSAGLIAVQAPDGEWEVMQHLGAELVAADTWLLTGFVRALAGSDPAAAALKPSGAAVVLLTSAVVRAETGSAERGVELTWRATPGGDAAAGSTTVTQAWRGLAARPWAPAHLGAETQAGGDVRFGWMRRARLGGEAWDGEPPLSEEAERYRAEVIAPNGSLLRGWETGAEAVIWTAAARAEDVPGGSATGLRLRVRQGSASFGWGAAAELAL